MMIQPSIRHSCWSSSLYLLAQPALAQTAPASQAKGDKAVRAHQPTLQAKVDFIAEFDQNGDGQVSHSEFFSARQQRLAVMDLQHNAQIDVAGYQAEYADRLDQRLAADRKGQLRQTEVRFGAVDKDQDGRISSAEYQASGQSAFAFIDSNKDGLISKADPAPKRRGQNTGATQPQRRPALVMPTTHSVSGMLAMYDVDHNGEVSPAEYLQIRQQAFARTDTDQSGDLSPVEYKHEFTDRVDQQIAKTRSAQLKQAEVRFKALDKDDNGILSAAEYHQSGQRMFSRWDTDHNRLVSYTEALPVTETAQASAHPSKAKPATRTAP
ncbi:MAG: hypothetical protein U5L02_04240 [Rheinheimera sp.]|nr:hypothetical protein [Rheinheimera sp.]